MASITMDPPHVVNTGAACSACCNVAPGRLLRCGACDSAWYCNQDCQRKHFKEHKSFCRALRLFHSLQKDLPPESWPRTARDFYVQRTNCQRILEPLLRRPLSRGELRAILGEARCSICMRTRSQLAKSGAALAAPAPAANGASAPLQSTAPAAAQQPAPAAPRDADTNGVGGPGSGSGNCCSGTSGGGSRPSEDSRTADTDDGAAAAAAAPDVSSAAPAESEPPAQTGTAAVSNSDGGAAALSCCPHCNWGWSCNEHRGAYLAGPHTAVCLSYQHMNDSQLLTQRYLTATGRLPNYVPDKLRPVGPSGSAWEPVPAGWAAFQAWRPLPVFDQAMMCLLSKRMSQALTVIQALQHHYTAEQLSTRSHLEVHVLGASAFEVPADRIWEELLNLLPPLQQQPTAAVAAEGAAAAAAPAAAGKGDGAAGAGSPARVLHVAFVGPELQDIIVEESDGRALPQGTALSVPPPPPARQLLYSYHLCPYQDFEVGRFESRPCPWRRPDIAVAFNSGVSEYDKALWAPALRALVRHGVPVMFTSYNDEEAAADAAVWRQAGGEVTLGPEKNPYRAMEPISEPSQVDTFYYQNYYWWCGRARTKR